MHMDKGNVTAERRSGMDPGALTGVVLACLTVWVLVVQAAPSWAAPPAIGTVVRATGAVTARAGDGDLRILGEGAPLFETDVLTTGGNSTAVIGLTDGSRITVRPDTIVALEAYAHGAEKEGALMRLFKGGMRALTGLIASRNPENGFQLHTATAVVGVRGTEFDAWLCEGECADTLARTGDAESDGPARVAGRVVSLKGRVTATAEAGERRVLLKNGPVHPGDVLETEDGGYAVVVFRDNSRVTLRSGTRFQVERYAYEQGADDGVMFRLLKGGVRFLTGLMAKRDPDSFRIGTPTAVVGVRGTGGQILLSDLLNAWGVTRQVLQAAGIDPTGDEFTVFMVTVGSISLTNEAGESAVFSGQVVIVFSLTESALDITRIRAIIDRIAAHEGDDPTLEFEVDLDALFQETAENVGQGGLVVVVLEKGPLELRHVGGELVLLYAGEGGMVTETSVFRLEQLPGGFDSWVPILNPEGGETGVLDALGGGSNCECTFGM